MEYKVAIDAGHGSDTSGKRTPDGYREHWINVRCAAYFNEALRRCGIKTVKIAWNDTNPTDDEDISLKTRQKMIKNSKCDISVSWHSNAYGDGKYYNNAQGIETLISNDKSKVRDSKSLADKVQEHLIKGTKQQNRGVKKQDLAMCNCPAMGTEASILIEIGFMTNEYEARLMKSEAFCLECAEEAAQGVCKYFGVLYIESTADNSPAYIYQGVDYSLVFNPFYYAERYPDLKKAFGNDASALFRHFCEYGMKEGRVASENFNVNKYKEYYEDLRAAFGDDLPLYYKHYILHGYKENRKAV